MIGQHMESGYKIWKSPPRHYKEAAPKKAMRERVVVGFASTACSADEETVLNTRDKNIPTSSYFGNLEGRDDAALDLLAALPGVLAD